MTVLLVDCPWKHDDALGKRGAQAKYSCMTVPELVALRDVWPVSNMPHDCIMLFWRLSNMQEEALEVIAAWGFRIKSEAVWKKLTETGKRAWGAGRWVRNEHETLLICARGKPKHATYQVRSVFEAQLREPHRKPDFQYEIAEALDPLGPYYEMFARYRRAGWIQHGNQLEPEVAAQ